MIARRAALEIRDGEVVNLGVGIPTLVSQVIGAGRSVFFHSENGILGFGPPPPEGLEDEDLVDAGKRPVTEIPGTCYFDSAVSFGMIRGGHIDCAVLGALQVDEEGTVANWRVPGRPQLGVGGSMDLLAGARRVIVVTTLTTAQDEPKIVSRCSLPVSAWRRAGMVITERAVFSCGPEGLRLEEIAPDLTPTELSKHVTARFSVSPDLKPLAI